MSNESVASVTPSKHRLPAVSIVLPCLNESLTIQLTLQNIDLLRETFANVEVILVDNGSHDGSIEIAKGLGVRVICCETRGYGATLRKGILAAAHEIIVFADTDATYDLKEAPELVKMLLHAQADLVVGNRLGGRLESGAMPVLHRLLGTPILNLLIAMLHGRRGRIIIGDCNCGFRALKRSAFIKWQTQSDGMEFASEMIVRALRSGSRYAEVPISYRKSSHLRKSNLRPWRDGIRHLNLILLAALKNW